VIYQAMKSKTTKPGTSVLTNSKEDTIMKISLPAQSVLLPSPVLIIGTYRPDGRPNIMNAACGGVTCLQPPSISVSLREATLTYRNIRQNGAFTVNIPSEKYMKEADFAGLVSGREYDKFKEAGLTPEKSQLVNAPIVKEFPYALECKLIHQVELGLHTMFIGEVAGMVADNEVLSPNRFPDIEKVRPMLFGFFGSMAYYGIGGKLGGAFSSGYELLRDKAEKM
jgi:flavin reductase (DIM6/NTAB) family NADH-FMN oxidoreductase RutF